MEKRLRSEQALPEEKTHFAGGEKNQQGNGNVVKGIRRLKSHSSLQSVSAAPWVQPGRKLKKRL